ncbi:MAG: Hint domain-containing protein [Sulfitobacter sp.]
MARISELHYSNTLAANSGVAEFLEVALGPTEDPADFTVSFYEADGSLGFEITLDDPLVVASVDPDNGELIYVLSAANLPIFLTDPDGGGTNNYEAYALTDTSAVPGTVIDFYDIGGGTQNITAVGGAAGGAMSENISTPTGPDTTTTSIQFNQPNPDTITYETLSPGDTGIACFTAGTLIETETGPKAIETLLPGDLIWTFDAGLQPVRWIGVRDVAGLGPMAPIRFETGAMGATETLFLSPQHRVLVTGWKAELLFGQGEVLVPAKSLINDLDIRRITMPRVTYVHVLLDNHQIVRTHGVLSESFLPGASILADTQTETYREIAALFPELGDHDNQVPEAARYICTVREGMAFRTERTPSA